MFRMNVWYGAGRGRFSRSLWGERTFSIDVALICSLYQLVGRKLFGGRQDLLGLNLSDSLGLMRQLGLTP